MNDAKVTVGFLGRPDGEMSVRQIVVGDVISGDLAAVALREGWAVEHGAADIEADHVDIHSMTVDKLKSFAEENGIDLGDSTKKADIIAAIELAIEQKP